MGHETKISWCDSTFNPWVGCTKVSPGCRNCYAESLNNRWAKGANWGKGKPRRRTSESNWKDPIRWDRKAAEAVNDHEAHKGLHAGTAHFTEPRRPRVFCASLADWLDEEVDVEWFTDLLEVIRETPFLDWLLLTKRPWDWKIRMEAAAERHFNAGNDDGLAFVNAWLRENRPPANVWIGTSAEDQERYDDRVAAILTIPAAVRFISFEPLLGPINCRFGVAQTNGPLITGSSLHWGIVGGESGPNARDMETVWARDIADQFRNAGSAFFMKQMGGRKGHRDELNDLPEDLRVRQFPV